MYVLNALEDVRMLMRQTAKTDPEFIKKKQQLRIGLKGTNKAMGREAFSEDEIKKQEDKANDIWWDTYFAPNLKEYYEPSLPVKEPELLKTFRDEYSRLSKRFDEQAKKRYLPHLLWVDSEQLSNALSVYDDNHDGSGIAFQNQVGFAVAGMGYTIQGAALLRSWLWEHGITPDTDLRSNILSRALCYNQTSIMDAVKKGLIAGQDGPELNDPSRAHYVQKILYGLTDLEIKEPVGGGWPHLGAPAVMKDVSKLFDRIIKAAGESANQAWMKNHPFLGAGLAVSAAVSDRALGASMNRAEQKLGKGLLALLPGLLGKSAMTVVSTLGPADPKSAPTRESIRLAAENELRNVSKNWQANTMHTGDYMRIRTASLIMFFEAINLFIKTLHKEDSENADLAHTAAIFACVAAGSELTAYGFRTVGRSGLDADVKQGARLAYGTLKLWAAGFGVASSLGVYFDATNAVKAFGEERYLLGITLGARATLQGMLAVSSFMTGFSETSVLFSVLAAKVGGEANRAGRLLLSASNAASNVNKAKWYLRSARGTWILIGISIVLEDIIDYVEIDSLDAVQKWCRRSCFGPYRLPSDNPDKLLFPPYTSYREECDALYEALKLVMSSKEDAEKAKTASTPTT
jgi:hypothetical protein